MHHWPCLRLQLGLLTLVRPLRVRVPQHVKHQPILLLTLHSRFSDDEPMPTLDDLVKDPALTLLVPGGGGIGDDNSDNDSIPAGLLDDEDEDELDDDE